MRTIPLTKGYESIVDDEDYDAVSKFIWTAVEADNGRVYAVRQVSGKPVYLHRFLLGIEDDTLVDHRDRDGLNNSKSNLRRADGTQNQGNRLLNANSTSGYKGVTWERRCRKWMAQIHFLGKCYYLGVYNQIDDAARAYDVKAKELFGEFARTNFPETKE